MMLFEKITEQNLDKFISLYNSLLPADLTSFRYFENRGIHHVLKIFSANMVISNNNPIGYFHIDIEEEVAWFGIFIKPSSQGKGYSHLIIEKAQEICRENNIQGLTLSVDRDNHRAISAYRNKCFVTFDNSDKRLFMRWESKA